MYKTALPGKFLNKFSFNKNYLSISFLLHLPLSTISTNYYVEPSNTTSLLFLPPAPNTMFSNETINFQNQKFLSFQTDGISVCGLHVQPRVDGAFVHDVSIASAQLRTVTLRCWMTVYVREKPQNVSKYALMKVRVQNGSLMNGIRWNSLIFKCITNILLLIKKWKILLFH